MTLRTLFAAGIAALSLTSAAQAEGTHVHITDAYARAAHGNAKSGAAFMVIENTGDAEDRLIAATSDAAARVELHTHVDNGDGVMQMLEDEDGFEIPAGGTHVLKRGGDHVMFMGLTQPFADGETVEVTLTFVQAGDVTVEIPIDFAR